MQLHHHEQIKQRENKIAAVQLLSSLKAPVQLETTTHDPEEHLTT